MTTQVSTLIRKLTDMKATLDADRESGAVNHMNVNELIDPALTLIREAREVLQTLPPGPERDALRKAADAADAASDFMDVI